MNQVKLQLFRIKEYIQLIYKIVEKNWITYIYDLWSSHTKSFGFICSGFGTFLSENFAFTPQQ